MNTQMPEEEAQRIVTSWQSAWMQRRGDLEFDIASAIRAAARAERETCAAIAETHPLAPDTTTGTRQRWLRQRIAQKIRTREVAK